MRFVIRNKSLRKVLLDDKSKECFVEHITVPEGVKSIFSDAFEGVQNVKSITLPSTLKSILTHAFSGCTSLETIFIPAALESISGGSFNDCCSLKSIEVDADSEYFCSVDGVLYTKNMSVIVCYPPARKEKGFTVPDGVKQIGAYAFYKCLNLESVVLPDSLMRIWAGSFSNSRNIVSLNVPPRVKFIGLGAFRRTKWIDSITEDFVILGDGVLYKYQGKGGKVVIPDNVRAISDGVFMNGEYITEVFVPDTVRVIGNLSLGDCDMLERIRFPLEMHENGRLIFKNTSQLYDTGLEYPTTGTLYDRFVIFSLKSPVVLNVGKYVFTEREYMQRAFIFSDVYQFSQAANYDECEYCWVIAAYDAADHSRIEAEEYVKQNAKHIINCVIERNDYDLLSKLVTINGVITKGNISQFIDHAIDNTQKGGDVKIQTLLIHYKNEYFPDISIEI